MVFLYFKYSKISNLIVTGIIPVTEVLTLRIRLYCTNYLTIIMAIYILHAPVGAIPEQFFVFILFLDFIPKQKI